MQPAPSARSLPRRARSQQRRSTGEFGGLETAGSLVFSSPACGERIDVRGAFVTAIDWKDKLCASTHPRLL